MIHVDEPETACRSPLATFGISDVSARSRASRTRVVLAASPANLWLVGLQRDARRVFREMTW